MIGGGFWFSWCWRRRPKATGSPAKRNAIGIVVVAAFAANVADVAAGVAMIATLPAHQIDRERRQPGDRGVSWLVGPSG